MRNELQVDLTASAITSKIINEKSLDLRIINIIILAFQLLF